MKGNFKSK